MSKDDYQKAGLDQLKLVLAGADSIGTANFIDSEAFIDQCVLHRIQKVAAAVDQLYAIGANYKAQTTEQERQLLTFNQYLSAVKSAPTIRGHLAEAEQPLPYQGGRMGNPVEDKIAAGIIEKKTGYNPMKDWQKADKIQQNRRKLESQHDPVTLHLVRHFDPTFHTPDRAGYMNFLYGQDRQFIIMLQESLPVAPDPNEARRHAYITGGSGSGKTELLKQLIHGAFHRYDEATIVIDPHGDLAAQVAHWEMFADDDRLLYVDPFLSGDHVPPFNPLDVPEAATMQQREVIAQQLVNAFEQLLKGSSGDSLTVNMRTILAPCILTLIDQPKATLADLQRFVNDRLNEDLVAIGRQSKRRAIRDFFTHDFVNDATLQTSKTAISRKLQSLFNTYAFDEVVNSPHSINLEGAINKGKVILFNLSKGRLGEEASEAFGRLIVASIQGLALRRADIPEEERVPINLFIDECQNYIAPATIQILEEARKYAVNMTLAQQVVGRGMSTEMRTVVLNNTNIKVAGRTPEDDKMAKILGKTQVDVQQLATGHFWMKVGNGGTFKLRANRDLLGNSISMSEEDWLKTVQKQFAFYRRLDNDAPNPLEAKPEQENPAESRKLV